jgi:hypothetical protein
MTPCARVEKVLTGGRVDVVPFTVYEGKFPQCAAEREMRNRGLCIVKRLPVFKTRTPNVKVKEEIFQEGGKKLCRTYYETPVGTLTTLREPAGFTSWLHEKMFKTPDDYKAIRFLIEDEIYEPDYASFRQVQEACGGDAIVRAGFGLEPLQALISGSIMDMQTFCLEWMDRRDEILKLYEALVAKRRQTYALVADSPALHANYGGNVVPKIIGLETFKQYYVPHYNEAAEVMHKRGKLIGTHLDDNNRLIAAAVAETALDYIEAFTPAPDTDLSLKEARAAWPDKVLWLNFPSSLHLKTDAEIEAATVAMLAELPSTDGVIMGITEDVPEHRWRHSFRAIMDGLDRQAGTGRGLTVKA